MRRMWVAGCLVGLAVAGAAACTPAAPAAATVSIVGTGTFECGGGYHACVAYVSIRPTAAGSGGAPVPAAGDAELPPTTAGSGRLVVNGPATGGVATLAPGGYRVVLTWIEISDQEPFALPSPGFAGSGIIATPMQCEVELPVAADTVHVAITAIAGPGCGISIELDPGP